MKNVWFFFRWIFGWGKKKVGKGNVSLHELAMKGHSGWVSDVTGIVRWVKPVTEEELLERRRRFWRHMWRTFKEKCFGSRPDHRNRYPHQIFNVEIEKTGIVVRVENNLTTGKELKRLAKGLRVEMGGEYLPNPKGGKLHHTHGQRGYVVKR